MQPKTPEMDPQSRGTVGVFKRIQTIFSRLTRPHPDIVEVGERNQAVALSVLSVTLLMADLVGMLASGIINRGFGSLGSLVRLVLLALLLAVLYGLSRTRYFRWGAYLSMAALSLLTFNLLLSNPIPDAGVAVVVYTYIVLGYVFAGVFAPAEAISLAVVINSIVLLTLPSLNPQLPAVETYTAAGTSMTIGVVLAVGVGLRARVERARLAEGRAINKQLEEMRQSLEVRVAERTRALQTNAEISRRLTTILNPIDLATAVVEDVQQAYGYYHTQVYLWDDPKETLELKAATGKAGQSLLQSEHKVPRGRGLVGRAADSGKPILAADARSERGWLPNPLLPETRSEAAVPVMVGERVVGVLDVQSDMANGLSQTDVDLLSALANQLGVAFENARQYADTQAALQDVSVFRRFADSSGQGMSLAHLDGELFYANPALLRLLGKESLDPEQQTQASAYYPPQFRQQLDDIISTIYRDGQWVGEMALQRPDGSIRPTLENMFLIKDAQEHPLYIADVITDMESAKKTEQALAQQVDELAKVAQISAEINAISNPASLLQRAVNRIQTSFGFYYVQVYLLDADRGILELKAGAGQVGERLSSQGWRINTDSERSLAARAIRLRQGVISNRIDQDPYYMANELLQKTAAEMVVPLIAGDTILGALDIQSDTAGRFTPADVAIQTTLAAQIAVAYQNARQYQQTQQSEALVRTIIDASPDWIYIKDLNHRFQLVNRSFAESLGLNKEDLIDKDELELGFDERAVKGDVEQGLVGAWQEDDEVARTLTIKSMDSKASMVGGEMRFLSTLKLPLVGEDGKATGVLSFVRDISDRERLQQETAERLAEIDNLYRTVSRQGWQALRQRQGAQTGYYYDRLEVAPDDGRWLEESRQAMQANAFVNLPGQGVAAVPLTLRGDVIGALAVQADRQHPLSPDELDLLQGMSDQVALALESARLFSQTQAALADTETLYSMIAEMNAAGGYQDILHTLAERTLLGSASPLLMMAVFDRPLTAEHRPEWIFPVAFRAAPGLNVAERYPLSAFEARPGGLFTEQPVIMSDIANDARLDRLTRTLFQDVFMGCSSVVFPLMLGKQMIGFIQGFYDKPVDFPVDEQTRLSAVAGQAAIAVQSRLLLEQAQSRAQREQRIRQVTAEVVNAPDVNTIMRRAVEEVGKAMGLPAYIYLGSQKDRESE